MNSNSIKNNGYYYVVLLSQIIVLLDLAIFYFHISDNFIIDIIRYAVAISASLLLIYNIFNHHVRIGFVKYLFIFWIVYLLLSAIPDIFNDYDNHLYLKQFLSNFFFLYLIPLLMVSDLRINFYRSLLKLAFSLLICYLLFSIPIFVIYGKELSYASEYLTILMGGSIILLMTLSYHKASKQAYILIASAIVIILMMLLARRNKVVFFVVGLMLAALLYVFSKSYSKHIVRSRIAFVVIGIIMIIAFVFFKSSFSLFFERMETGMESREGIIKLFFNDFDSHKIDYLWGRGIFGQFKGGVLASKDDFGLRDGIENGYLMLILKGGWIWLGLLIIISAKAVYFGLFKSRNKLCKGFALIILLYYVDMIGFGIPEISLKYIMVFIAIAACNSRWLRDCKDDYLAKTIGL